MRRSLSFLAAAALPWLAACAAHQAPRAELDTARAAVAQAQPAAARHAPEQLERAQAKLARAEAAMARYDYDEARRLAEQAAADARVAEAMTDSSRMQAAVAEVDQATRALREQIEGRSRK